MSVFLLRHMKSQLDLIELARVRAEYAVQSGVAMGVTAAKSASDLRRSFETRLRSGEEVIVHTQPWGALVAVTSTGRAGKGTATLTALASDAPSPLFRQALVFGNQSHQLIFAGTSSIVGDISVGQSGASTGTLKERPPPRRLPVTGSVSKVSGPSQPLFSSPWLTDQLHEVLRLLEESRSQTRVFSNSVQIGNSGVSWLDPSLIADSTEYVFVRGDLRVSQSIHRDRPLRVVVTGNVRISSSARITGLIHLIASGPITVEDSVATEQVVLSSQESVSLEDSVSFSGQIIAPLITVSDGAMCTYPTVLLSTREMGGSTATRGIHLGGNTTVEGTVIMIPQDRARVDEQLIVIEPSATVVGTVYTTGAMTLDGTVIGTVITNDFYFYEAPTQYFGWLRSGRINREELPRSFLVPPGFQSQMKLQVLDWL